MSSVSGPRYRQLPLWRDASRFLLDVEQAVRRFPQHHKYTSGSELRGQTMQICRPGARVAHCPSAVQRERQLRACPCTAARRPGCADPSAKANG